MSVFAQDVVAITVTLLINVSESPTAADSITSQMGAHEVNAVEAPAAADAVVAQMGDFEISVNEQPTVADVVADIDLITPTGDEDVDVAELPSVADVPNISIGDFEININDPPTATDVVTIEVGDLEVNVSESPSAADVIDNIVASAPGDEDIDVNEQPSVADVVTAELSDLEIDVNEQPSVVDAIDALIASDVDVVEQPSASDSADSLVVSNVDVSDSPTAADSVDVEEGDLEVNINEQPSVADVIDDIQTSGAGDESVNVKEQPSASDVVSIAKDDLEIDVSESPSAADVADVSAGDVKAYETPVAHDYVSVWIEGAGPGPPTMLSIGEDYSDALVVRWTAVGGADYYNIYKSFDGIDFFLVHSTEEDGYPTATVFIDKGNLDPDTQYWYRVTAANAYGESPPSTAMSGTTNSRDMKQVVVADAIELFFDSNQYPNNLASIFSIYTQGSAWINGTLGLGGDVGMSGGKNIYIATDGAVHWGGEVAGAWRIIPSGNNLVFQRYEGGTWVTKYTITP